MRGFLKFGNKLTLPKATLKTGNDPTASETLFLISTTLFCGVFPKNFNVKWIFPGCTQEAFKPGFLNRFCIKTAVSITWGGISIARNSLIVDIVYQGLGNNVKRYPERYKERHDRVKNNKNFLFIRWMILNGKKFVDLNSSALISLKNKSLQVC